MKNDDLTEKELKVYKSFHFFGIAISTGMLFWFYIFQFSEMTRGWLLIFTIPLLMVFTFGYAIKWDVRVIPYINRFEEKKSRSP